MTNLKRKLRVFLFLKENKDVLVNIRPYHMNDQPQLLELLRLNTPHFFDPSEEKEFLEYLQQDSENYFIIEEANNVIGSGGFNYGFDHGKTARISWGIVHPDWHGKKVGKKLTQFRISEIKKRPEVEKIIVRTTKVVHGFYQKQGFELEKIVKDYWAPGFDLYQMKMIVRE